MDGLTEREFGWVIGFFEAKGTYCKAGNDGKNFALEAFAKWPEQLTELADLVGGTVYEPPPAAPNRWLWRLYGDQAKSLFASMRPFLTRQLMLRGEMKLQECR